MKSALLLSALLAAVLVASVDGEFMYRITSARYGALALCTGSLTTHHSYAIRNQYVSKPPVS